MRFLTIEEASRHLGELLDDDGKPRLNYPDLPTARFSLAQQPIGAVVASAEAIAGAVGPWEESWLWIDKPDGWNRPLLPLYYRTRQAHNDNRLVIEAPVHMFLRYEYPDLLSFVVLALLNEWPAFLVTSYDYGRVHFTMSHSLSVARSDLAEFTEVVTGLRKLGFEQS